MSATLPSQQEVMSEQEAKTRADLYLRQRINYQENFYRSCIEEFRYNSDRMLWVSAMLMGISTIVASASVVTDTLWPTFIAALLPACAAAVSAFRSLYQWERQMSLYEQTLLALQQARLALPDEDFMQPGDYMNHFPELVRQAEEVLRNEASQWGQLEGVMPTIQEAEKAIPAGKTGTANGTKS